MSEHRCDWPHVPCANCAAISELQRRLQPAKAVNRTRHDYRRTARWLELEVRRGYASAGRTALYAKNMRWAAELTRFHGDGSWTELLTRSGNKAPDIDKMLATKLPDGSGAGER